MLRANEQLLPLSDILKNRRRELGLELDDVQRSTKISKQHINAIETKNFQSLPSKLYTKNFIKSYSTFLEVSEETKIREFLSMYEEYCAKEKQNQQVKKYLANTSKKPIDFPKIIKNGIGTLLIIFVLGYIGIEIKAIFQPPILSILEPDNNIVTKENSITIVGMTEKNVDLRINNEPVFIDETAEFQTVVSLKEGINIIQISAKKKHSKETIVQRQILLDNLSSVPQSETSKEISRR
jgi:cytoskeletal protein RodZ